LSSVLGLSRAETDAYLKLHKVFEGSLTKTLWNCTNSTSDLRRLEKREASTSYPLI
jgi:hypothetical protein